MDWADEKAQQIAECTDFFKRRHTIAQALRDVQRETAEECCKVLSETSLSKFLILDVEFLEAIRARFNLEPK